MARLKSFNSIVLFTVPLVLRLPLLYDNHSLTLTDPQWKQWAIVVDWDAVVGGGGGGGQCIKQGRRRRRHAVGSLHTDKLERRTTSTNTLCLDEQDGVYVSPSFWVLPPFSLSISQLVQPSSAVCFSAKFLHPNCSGYLRFTFCRRYEFTYLSKAPPTQHLLQARANMPSSIGKILQP